MGLETNRGTGGTYITHPWDSARQTGLGAIGVYSCQHSVGIGHSDACLPYSGYAAFVGYQVRAVNRSNAGEKKINLSVHMAFVVEDPGIIGSHLRNADTSDGKTLAHCYQFAEYWSLLLKGINLSDHTITYDNSFGVLTLSPQMYPNSPGVHVSRPHTLVTFAAEHPDKRPQ